MGKLLLLGRDTFRPNSATLSKFARDGEGTIYGNDDKDEPASKNAFIGLNRVPFFTPPHEASLV